MSSEYWKGVLNRLPDFFQKTSAMCLGASIMTSSGCCHRHTIFPMAMTMGMPYTYMPFSQYTPYQQYSPYSQYSPYQQYSPYMTNPTYPQYTSPYPSAPYPGMYQQPPQIQDAGAVEETQSNSLGRNIVNGEDTQFVSNNWQTLDKSTTKTPQQNYQLVGKYTDFVSNLAKSFVTYIDKSNIGNKDGYLSKEEFQAYYVIQKKTNESQEAEIEALKTEANKVFASLDQTKEGKLDWKEAAAFFSMADAAGATNQYDGTIKKEDTLKAMKNIVDNSTAAQNKLRENYGNLFNRRV